jgi:hypothetical protein
VDGLSFGRTPDGPRVEVSRRVDAPVDAAWTLLTDVTRWPEWGPSVREVDCDPDQLDEGRFVREGTRGRVRLPVRAWVPFRVTSCADHRWTWRVGLPAARRRRAAIDRTPSVAATGHRVEPTEDGCRVVFEVPPLAVGYVPVCRRALGTVARLLEDERS